MSLLYTLLPLCVVSLADYPCQHQPFKYLSDPNDFSSYVICNDEHPKSTRCPDDFYFNGNTNNCVPSFASEPGILPTLTPDVQYHRVIKKLWTPFTKSDEEIIRSDSSKFKTIMNNFFSFKNRLKPVLSKEYVYNTDRAWKIPFHPINIFISKEETTELNPDEWVSILNPSAYTFRPPFQSSAFTNRSTISNVIKSILRFDNPIRHIPIRITTTVPPSTTITTPITTTLTTINPTTITPTTTTPTATVPSRTVSTSTTIQISTTPTTTSSTTTTLTVTTPNTITTMTTTPNSPTRRPPPKCTIMQSFVIPDPEDCKFYYVCFYGNFNRYTCPDLKLLDYIKKKCVPEDEARCA